MIKTITERYIAYHSASGESEFFSSFEQAEKWLEEAWDEDLLMEGYQEDTVNGLDYIALITHRSKFTAKDKKENYHEHTDDCPEDCDKEEWPHSDFDAIGVLELEDLYKQEEGK